MKESKIQFYCMSNLCIIYKPRAIISNVHQRWMWKRTKEVLAQKAAKCQGKMSLRGTVNCRSNYDQLHKFFDHAIG